MQVVEAHRLTLAPREEIQRFFSCLILHARMISPIVHREHRFAFSAVYCLNQHEGPPGTLFFVSLFWSVPSSCSVGDCLRQRYNMLCRLSGGGAIIVTWPTEVARCCFVFTNNVDTSCHARGPHTHQDAQLKRRLHVELGTNKLVKEPCP